MGKYLIAWLGVAAVLAGLGTGIYFYGKHVEHEEMQAEVDKLKAANSALAEANTLHEVAALAQNQALSDLRLTCEAAKAATKAEAAKVEKVAADRDAIAKQLRAARGAVSADQSCDAGLKIVRERMTK